jgi:hypothetical protein
MLGIVLGVIVFVILGVTVAEWWVAAITGLGVILVASMVDGLIQMNRITRT